MASSAKPRGWLAASKKCSGTCERSPKRSMKCCFWLMIDASLSGRMAMARCLGRAWRMASSRCWSLASRCWPNKHNPSCSRASWPRLQDR
ncbi:hypothetical protein WR25_13685 [Diploscapter pachys]|uniref:Uncharacterized protein n=1 Tax=Diploscapter pachys TaxID=2018661 RepID=A0A2A2M635_9BILA|nr:hypothetical protein WR25_13685 [Diploscapter pachys]